MGSDPRTARFVPASPARDDGSLVLSTILAAVCALLTLVMTEVLLMAELRTGWLCTNPPASPGQPLAPVGSLESSLLPPRAVRTYPALQDSSTTVGVDDCAAGTMAFWVSLAVLAVCAVIGVPLQQRNSARALQ